MSDLLLLPAASVSRLQSWLTLRLESLVTAILTITIRSSKLRDNLAEKEELLAQLEHRYEEKGAVVGELMRAVESRTEEGEG